MAVPANGTCSTDGVGLLKELGSESSYEWSLTPIPLTTLLLNQILAFLTEGLAAGAIAKIVRSNATAGGAARTDVVNRLLL